MPPKPAPQTITPMHLAFTVPGEAVPQGSMRAFMPKGWTRPILTNDNPRTKPWRAMVAAAAIDAQYSQGTWPHLSDRAIRIDIACYFVRPASVSERKRPSHTVKPDASKLLRAIEDALTKILWADDAQVIAATIHKTYAPADEPAHAVIRVAEIIVPIPAVTRTNHIKRAAGMPLLEDARV